MKAGRLVRGILVVFLAVGTAQAQSTSATGATQQTPAYGELAGNYRLPNKNVLGIDQFLGDDGKPTLLYSDYRSGIVRLLFPMADGRFGMGPGFAVASPVELTIRFIRDDRGAVTAIAVQQPGQRELVARQLAIAAQEVTFKGADATLAGTLLTPSTPGPHAAIVLLHGSGRLTRYSFGPYPHFFTSLGFAVLVYDKRDAPAVRDVVTEVRGSARPLDGQHQDDLVRQELTRLIDLSTGVALLSPPPVLGVI